MSERGEPPGANRAAEGFDEFYHTNFPSLVLHGADPVDPGTVVIRGGGQRETTWPNERGVILVGLRDNPA